VWEKKCSGWPLFKRRSQLSGAAIFIAQLLKLSTLICFTTGEAGSVRFKGKQIFTIKMHLYNKAFHASVD
jgi:hypothetical protein